ncbi:hypothetical protein Sru01_66010 [Sphaerisporangium rufum]|uniref:Transcriptional regulator n=1 Tax=Sphaerisporangium rufum TaxID=1381558 RepID=A0A919R8Z9_9ACTN|nr:hypothetical protein [Sphaerisporangium rufum]GII81619.1 hypothetical protein Sru01_66010 [Sphaerisporangium rufum]
MRREPNHHLRLLLAEAGFSHKGLARRLNDLGAARGLTGLRYDHSSVLRWLGGQQPREPVPALLAEIFAARLGRRLGTEDLGMAGGATPLDLGQLFSHSWREGIETVTALWRADMERRRFLLDSTFAVGAGSAGALGWLTAPPAAAPSATGPRRVGAADVTAIREVTRSFGDLDNRFGGGRVRSAVVKYLDSTVTPLLKDGHYDEATGRDLAAAAAEATRVAGWMAYDLEQHGLAQRYLLQALSLARGAGDQGLGGEILAGLAHQAIYVGRPRHGLDLARAVQVAAREVDVPALLAESHVLQAHAHAALGDGTACAAALHQADLAFDRRRPGEEPEWIRYFDEAYLAAKYAHCFRDLGDGPRAVRYAHKSLRMDGRYVRGRMFNLSLLASGHVLCGEVEPACTAGGAALDLAAGLQSVRTRSYVADLRRRLAPLRDHAEVAALVRRADELAPAA